MTTAALVLTLSSADGPRSLALAALQARDDVEVGPASELRLPVVLTCDDADGATRELSGLPGVEHTEIIFVGLDEPNDPTRGDQPSDAPTRAAPLSMEEAAE